MTRYDADAPGHSEDRRIVFLNGEFLPERDARISIFDHSVLYGDGAFDTLVAWKGHVFKLEAHLDRLMNSLRYLSIESPYERAELRSLILEVIRTNGLNDSYVRCIITRGITQEPLLDPRGAVPGCIIFARPYLRMLNPTAAEEGARLKTVSIRRTPTVALEARVKSLNYLNIVMARIEATAAGADNALMLDVSGRVCEGAGFNVFVRNGENVRTPSEEILEGITRETVLEILRELDIFCVEGRVELFDIYTADELLLTSTAGGVMSAVEVDGRPIGSGVPGPLYARVSSRYYELLESGNARTSVYDLQDSKSGVRGEQL